MPQIWQVHLDVECLGGQYRETHGGSQAEAKSYESLYLYQETRGGPQTEAKLNESLYKYQTTRGGSQAEAK